MPPIVFFTFALDLISLAFGLRLAVTGDLARNLLHFPLGLFQ
jgi:hypothetical protein